MKKIKIIGGGLAGSEAAYQLLKRGCEVVMYEMRPNVMTPAHTTARLAELVCSNSFKSVAEDTPQGALKLELKELDSLILKTAQKHAVPAGGALAVDRNAFAEEIEKTLLAFDKFTLIRQEHAEINDFTIIASGPLTSRKLSDRIKEKLGMEYLYFYDAAAPIVTYESIDLGNAFWGGRYGKGGDDYLNCPMDKEQYCRFVENLVNAERVILKEFENKEVFSACMPIEVMAERGMDSLRFGPFRPVGLKDPKTSQKPYAALQLRKEDGYDRLYNLVGCQTNLKFAEQKRVFSLIPALKNAEFARYGVMHRNTFINSPKTLNADFSLRTHETVFFAGQISGVEGYMESCMSGLMAAINIYRKSKGQRSITPDEYTMCGSLMRYISGAVKDFQPMHVSFALLPPLEENIKDKKQRKTAYTQRAVKHMKEFITKIER